MTQLADETMDMHLSNIARFDTETAPAWLDELRKAGTARFEEVGFPTTKQEEWRHTNVAAIARTRFVLGEPDVDAAAPVAAEFSFGDEALVELVFVNGHFAPQLSKLERLPRGVTVRSLAEAIDAGEPLVRRHLGKLARVVANPFVALNTGHVRDGAFLHFARSTTVPGPIHLLFVSTSGAGTDGEPTVSHPRALVVFDDNVEATLVETHAGTAGAYFTNAVTEIVVGADCRIDHCKMQQESLAAYHVATQQATLGRSSTFVSHSTTLGGKLTRNDLNCVMAGEGAYAILNGLVVIGDSQHCDNHTLLDHAVPNCPSHELYKHVLSGKATGVFKGKILVRQPAQKTDSKQSSKSLLLSDDATMNSQPALEIYADDVKCTHGSTTGPVDEDMIFYLRTRGVGLEAARHLLTYAFAADVTRRIKVEPVRRRIEDFMAAQHGLPQDLRITDLGAFDEAVL
jgi:Fe-S cluster assembly protein SufD